MTEKKSDFRRFCETMWIMTKYDVLPWLVAAGIVAAVVFELKNTENQNKLSQQEQTAAKAAFFQRQR